MEGWGNLIGQILLVPSSGGIFDIDVDGANLFTKKMLGHYPEPHEVIDLLRSVLGPEVEDEEEEE